MRTGCCDVISIFATPTGTTSVTAARVAVAQKTAAINGNPIFNRQRTTITTAPAECLLTSPLGSTSDAVTRLVRLRPATIG